MKSGKSYSPSVSRSSLGQTRFVTGSTNSGYPLTQGVSGRDSFDRKVGLFLLTYLGSVDFYNFVSINKVSLNKLRVKYPQFIIFDTQNLGRNFHYSTEGEFEP